MIDTRHDQRTTQVACAGMLVQGSLIDDLAERWDFWHCRRLCPTYATDINSPLRHVRTRIYFTSESHVHSLLNVLRFCQLGARLPAKVASHPSFTHVPALCLFAMPGVARTYESQTWGRP